MEQEKKISQYFGIYEIYRTWKKFSVKVWKRHWRRVKIGRRVLYDIKKADEQISKIAE